MSVGVVTMGALWLLGVGLLLLVPAGLALFVGYIAGPAAGPCYEYGLVGCDDALWLASVGLLALGVSAAHVAAFVGIWTRRSWGRWLGVLLTLAALGVLVVGVLSAGDWLRTALGMVLVPFLGYGSTALALLVWYPPAPSVPGAPGREPQGLVPSSGQASSRAARHRPAIIRRR